MKQISRPWAYLALFLMSATGGLVSAADNGIKWFEGSVSQAFTQAEKLNKPLFLYWGAQWCPPCNQLKATLFKSPSFIEKTRFFIPVYLDGDTERAQKLGESFHVMGYPTLILFTSDGKEITRLPGGVDLARYPELLDLALQKTMSVSDLVTLIFDKNYQPGEEELQLLAYYSWQQDADRALKGRDPITLFDHLSNITPTSMAAEQSRFDAGYLNALSKEQEIEGTELRTKAQTRLERILGDTDRARASLYFVLYDAKDVISSLAQRDSQAKERLSAQWQQCLTLLGKNPSLSATDKLRLYHGEIALYELLEQPVPEKLQADIRKQIADARKQAEDVYEQIDATYTGYGVLHASGQDEAAQALMKQALQENSNTSYWMLVLASMAKDAEQPEVALKWYQQAYSEASGPATRLQWGSYYIGALCQSTPDETAGIESLGNSLLDEVESQKDPFHGRNMRVLKRIMTNLDEWAQSEEKRRIANSLLTRSSNLCLSQNDAAHCQQLKPASGDAG